MISQNKETELAFNFLQYTDRNLFLTGQAGTGKTTFLKSLASRLNKRFVILAPTGVAALNAGGVTVHSFFQLPFHAILPGNKFETRKFSKQKINLIRSLDLIIIDEVSMVRCDVIDGVDRVLKTLRRDTKNRPFGGVQVLMIGDLNQLPPIATEEDEMMLRPYYNNFYFFSSNALKQSNYITISLKHIYRQEDKTFINILNNVRDKKTTPQDIEILNRCYKKDILNEVPENYIVLCTHNIQADKINVAKINALKGEDKLYKAEINGIFPDNTYPNSEKLHLKVGAQVMFLKNDYESIGKKKYYNGKIGVITYLDDEFVKVKCPDDEDEIFVQRYTWTNFEYTMKKDTKELTLKEKGTFSQFPLKLAWAITIHKSQGLTFDKAIINSNQAFSHGQVYVALSRCRSLEGMILSEPFNYSSVILDANVRYFND
ncbi:MAG: AAA family ATPase, partial [Bacteroidales bacterium]|nr:AAA family ATPase [Bacteroidales bacterium]